MDEIMMFPLTDLDGVVEEKSVKVVRNGENNQAMSVSLLKRRRSQHINQLKPLKLSGKHEEARDSTDSGYDSTRECVSPTTSAKEIISPVKAVAEIKCKSSPKLNWQKALRKISSLKDPWEKFFMANLPVERAKRHRYNALRKVWSVDEVNVKMEKEPFNHGAMRECYRVKKLSTFSVSHDWHHAMNYVAKKYMQNVDNSVYFEDVKLQMDAKLWGEEYNRHRPPKKVDIFQICILEFIDRPGQPLYHLEHFIEGDYIKYNSNSGFVDDHMRYTPQAFSHFTFERSGHELIVVDIQGVDDLWTDPQIHTADGLGFGDGNLGVNGMALFFHSHICNSICESLSLSKFDLAPSELQKLAVAHGSQHCKSSAMTVVRGQEEMCISASPLERSNLHAFLMRCRSRTISSTSAISEHSDQLDDDDDSHGSNSHLSVSNRYRTISGHHDNTGSDDDDIPESPASSSLMSPTNSELLSPPIRIARRTRFISESDDTTSADEEEQMRQLMKSHHSRPSCVNTGTLSQLGYGHHDDCILGRIHHSLAIYHEMGRFGSDIDWEAAAYHEKQAAELNVLDAMLTMAKISLGLPHELLANCSLDIDIDTGVTYMLKAAITGDRSAMIYMAEAYLTGNGLGSRQISYGQAVDWYLRAISASQHENSDDFDATIDHPVYQLQAKVAELYLQGGPDLDKDPQSAADLYNQAAENATNAMKGRLASTYYCKAEEALAMCEEE